MSRWCVEARQKMPKNQQVYQKEVYLKICYYFSQLVLSKYLFAIV